jgi:hypothetical protein
LITDSGREIGLKLCNMLGINADRVQTVVLCCHAGEPARITVCSTVPPNSLDDLPFYVSTYELRRTK